MFQKESNIQRYLKLKGPSTNLGFLKKYEKGKSWFTLKVNTNNSKLEPLKLKL